MTAFRRLKRHSFRKGDRTPQWVASFSVPEDREVYPVADTYVGVLSSFERTEAYGDRFELHTRWQFSLGLPTMNDRQDQLVCGYDPALTLQPKCYLADRNPTRAVPATYWRKLQAGGELNSPVRGIVRFAEVDQELHVLINNRVTFILPVEASYDSLGHRAIQGKPFLRAKEAFRYQQVRFKQGQVLTRQRPNELVESQDETLLAAELIRSLLIGKGQQSADCLPGLLTEVTQPKRLLQQPSVLAAILDGVGPHGALGVLSPCSGVCHGFVDGHVVIGQSAIPLPVTAQPLVRNGDTVSAKQLIADLVPRRSYDWASLQAAVGDDTGMLLACWLEQQIRAPDYGYHGSGYLVPRRLGLTGPLWFDFRSLDRLRLRDAGVYITPALLRYGTEVLSHGCKYSFRVPDELMYDKREAKQASR